MNNVYDLLKKISQDVENLELGFYKCKVITDKGFEGVAKALAKLQGLRKLVLDTSSNWKGKTYRRSYWYDI